MEDTSKKVVRDFSSRIKHSKLFNKEPKVLMHDNFLQKGQKVAEKKEIEKKELNNSMMQRSSRQKAVLDQNLINANLSIISVVNCEAEWNINTILRSKDNADKEMVEKSISSRIQAPLYVLKDDTVSFEYDSIISSKGYGQLVAVTKITLKSKYKLSVHSINLIMYDNDENTNVGTKLEMNPTAVSTDGNTFVYLVCIHGTKTSLSTTENKYSVKGFVVIEDVNTERIELQLGPAPLVAKYEEPSFDLLARDSAIIAIDDVPCDIDIPIKKVTVRDGSTVRYRKLVSPFQLNLDNSSRFDIKSDLSLRKTNDSSSLVVSNADFLTSIVPVTIEADITANGVIREAYAIDKKSKITGNGITYTIEIEKKRSVDKYVKYDAIVKLSHLPSYSASLYYQIRLNKKIIRDGELSTEDTSLWQVSGNEVYCIIKGVIYDEHLTSGIMELSVQYARQTFEYSNDQGIFEDTNSLIRTDTNFELVNTVTTISEQLVGCKWVPVPDEPLHHKHLHKNSEDSDMPPKTTDPSDEQDDLLLLAASKPYTNYKAHLEQLMSGSPVNITDIISEGTLLNGNTDSSVVTILEYDVVPTKEERSTLKANTRLTQPNTPNNISSITTIKCFYDQEQESTNTITINTAL